MRSKKIRIVVTGSFLTLFAVVALVQRTSSQQVVSDEKTSVSVPAQAAAAPAEITTNTAPTAQSVEQSAADFAYISKPSNAAAIEATLGTPAHEVSYAKVDRLVAGGERSPLMQPGSQVELSLPNGAKLPVVIKSAEALGEGRYTSEGQVAGSDAAAVFAINNGELSAVIDGLELGSWQVRAVGDSVAQVFKVDPALVPPCGTDGIAALSQNTPASGLASEVLGNVAGGSTTLSSTFAPVAALLGAKQTVRILVPYSTRITKSVSASAVKSGIDLSIATMNTDLARSNVPVRVVLAGAPAVTYSQDGNESSGVAVDRALTRLTSGTDNILDSVHVTRYSAKADLVCLLISQVDSTNSGVGYVLTTPRDVFNATYGFSVISYGYLNSSRTFSHEVGHNLGCAHDRAHASSTEGGAAKGSYAYSYGINFHGKNGTQYRTIMAYPPGQVAAYYSNPGITAPSPVSVKLGISIGSSGQASNAQTITNNAAEVANYHNSRLVSRMSSNVSRR